MTRIYTEDTNRDGILALLDVRFDAYTVIPTLGRWRGKSEPSLVIEVAGQDIDVVRDAAQAIKEMNKQDAVLVVSEPTQEQLI